MAAGRKAGRRRSTSAPAKEFSSDTVVFSKVREAEHAEIDKRRKAEGRDPVKVVSRNRNDASDDSAIYDTVGLALSGGGIRSAAFCMGALQALQVAGLVKYIDYMSTVSGGGYIGSSLSAALSGTGEPDEEEAEESVPPTSDPTEKFPFQSRLDNQDPPAVRHIRDYSNYLMPNGIADIIGSIVIYLRGLVANAAIVVLWLLFFAILTVLFKPTRQSLSEPVIGHAFNVFELNHFVITIYLLIAYAGLLLGWSVVLSTRLGQKYSDTRSWFTRRVGTLGVFVLFIAFCELQPVALKNLFERSTFGISPWVLGTLASLSITVAILSNVIDTVLKTTTDSDRLFRRFLAGAGKVAIVAAAAILPLLLWASYLQIVFWGIYDNVGPLEGFFHTPAWIYRWSNWLWEGCQPFASLGNERKILVLYVIVFSLSLTISSFLQPNANSLHRLYRDRLSRAFLFDFVLAREDREQSLVGKRNREVFVEHSAGKPVKLELRPQDSLKLSQLNTAAAPYHLINTALNIQGSRHVNQRARNAEFFVLSKRYCGSEPTGYVDTRAVEDASPNLDLATAMAVSGAAASANAGANTNRLLTPTLTLLNVRLGLWLKNPRPLWLKNPDALSGLKRFVAGAATFLNYYFFCEMFGRLDEKSPIVYLTDGGHVENLGVYELLKRRCHIIIVVDAEADPEMNFSSLIKLQRHASIDLGVRIELPWRPIRETTLAVGRQMAANEGQGAIEARLGPHCAAGRVVYDDEQWGVLFYVKSSISGDENDYILDYKRRNASFPHETTNDQFFSEEQFEVYRALGFHAVNRVLAGEEAVPTHSGLNEGLYEPIIKIWTNSKFKDPQVDKAEEIRRFAAGDAGTERPMTEKVLPTPPPPKPRRARGRKTD